MATNTSKKTRKSKAKAWEWSPVDPHEVITVTQDHRILLGGELITNVDLENLRAEIKAFKNFKLWRLFDHTLRQKAIEMGFVNAETWERTMSGKMMLHNLGIMKSIMEAVTTMPTQHTPPVPPRPPKHLPNVIHTTIANREKGV